MFSNRAWVRTTKDWTFICYGSGGSRPLPTLGLMAIGSTLSVSNPEVLILAAMHHHTWCCLAITGAKSSGNGVQVPGTPHSRVCSSDSTPNCWSKRWLTPPGASFASIPSTRANVQEWVVSAARYWRHLSRRAVLGMRWSYSKVTLLYLTSLEAWQQSFHAQQPRRSLRLLWVQVDTGWVKWVKCISIAGLFTGGQAWC